MPKPVKLAIAISSVLLANVVYAGDPLQIPRGTTGYAAVLKDGNVVKVYPTYNHGIISKSSMPKVISYSDAPLPEDFVALNPSGIVKIRFDKNALLHAKTGDTVIFTRFGQDTPVVFERIDKHANGDEVWIGKINNDSRVIITFGADGTVIGRIDAGTVTYSVEPAGGDEAWLIDNDVAGRSSPSLEGDSHIPTNAGSFTGTFALSDAESVNELETGPSSTPGVDRSPASDTVIDIMVLYSPNLPDAVTRVNHLVTTANQAYIDSGLPNLSVRLVDTEALAYDDATANTSALTDLTGHAKAFSKVDSLRTKYGADVVVYLRPLNMAAQSSCGIAWVNGANGSLLSANNAYAVVSDGMDGSYFCYNTTLAHELGHVMGAVHDQAHSSFKGTLPYAYGYGISNLYGDIMSYYNPQIPKFSSPDIVAIDGTQSLQYLGVTDQADVVRTFKQTAPIVAGFLPSAVK